MYVIRLLIVESERNNLYLQTLNTFAKSNIPTDKTAPYGTILLNNENVSV